MECALAYSSKTNLYIQMWWVYAVFRRGCHPGMRCLLILAKVSLRIACGMRAVGIMYQRSFPRYVLAAVEHMDESPIISPGLTR